MAIICDRSPCNRLLAALGKCIFGAVRGNQGQFTLDVATDQGRETISLEYCPFCGTRLEEIGPGLLKQFLPEAALDQNDDHR